MDVTNILNAQKTFTNKIYQAIESLGILTIIDCTGVNPHGFIIESTGIEGVENSKHLISEGSLCVCYVQKVEEADYIGDISQFIGQEKIIDVYIRLGLTNTWMHVNFETAVYVFLEALFERNYGDYDEDEDGDEGEYVDDVDYERINRLSTIVAKSKGFGLLKNRDQRIVFSKEILGNSGEEVADNELYGIAANAESFYDFGVLPITARRMQLDGKTEAEIAKILGHTKARIEKSMLIDVPDVIRKTIEEYEENNT